MKKRSGMVIALLVSAFVMAAVAGCGAPSASKPPAKPPAKAAAAPGTQTLKIGVLTNETGWFSPIDLPGVYELKSYVNVLNGQDGVKIGNTTYKIQLVVEDGQSNNADLRASAKALADGGCKYVIETNDFWVLGAENIFEKAGIMHLNAYCVGVPGFISPKNPNAFTGNNGSIGDYTIVFKILKKYFPKVKSAVLAIDDNGNVPALNKQLQADGAKYGIKVLNNYVIYPGSTPDMSALATKIAATGADAFVTQGTLTTIGGVLKELRHNGNNMVAAGITEQNADAILKVAGKDAFNNGFDLGVVMTDPHLPPVIKAVVNREKQDYGPGIVDSYTGAYFNNLYELLYVMQQAKSIDVPTVEKEWSSLPTIQTPLGPAKVTGMGTYGVKHALAMPTPVALFKNGKVVLGGYVTPDLP